MKETRAPKTQQQAFDNLLDKMYITNVQKRLRELNQPSDTDKKRWVWELIQNAKDSIAGTSRETVNVRIVIEGDTVRFCHDGAPFTANARLGLLYKYSEDKENQESTGRFGTGFLTTHCLSKIVSIESNIYTNEEQTEVGGFFVTMHRDGITNDELLDGLKLMRESEKWYEDTFEWTSFIYHIKSDSGREARDLGIKNFKDNIAQTLLFCKEVSSVVLDDNGSLLTITRKPSYELENGFFRTEFVLEENGASSTRIFLHKSHREPSEELSSRYKNPRDLRFDVAIEVDRDNNIIIHKGSTDLFCSLPLVGIENQFNQPFIFNSPDFEPDSERQSLLLNGVDTSENCIITEVGINRVIFKKVMPYYEDLVSYLSSNEYKALYGLASGLKSIKEHNQTDKDWYKTNVLYKYREILEKYPVATSLESRLTLSNCIIVKETKEDSGAMYRLLSQLYPQQVLSESDNENWARFIWSEDEENKHLKCWAISDFCQHISDSYSNINSIPTPNALGWIDELLAIVNQRDASLLSQYNLIPNMNGDLCAKSEQLRQAIGMSDSIVTLFEQLGSDIKGTLLHSGITSISLENKYKTENYSSELNSVVEEILKDNKIENKLSFLSPLYAIVPNEGAASFMDKRLRVLGILCSVQKISIPQNIDNCLQETAWKAADIYLLDELCVILEKLGSLENLRKEYNLDVKWLDGALTTLADFNGIQTFDKYKIIPNQDGAFNKKEVLCLDKGVLEEFKDDVFKTIDIDYKSILLDTSIDGVKLGISIPKNNDNFVSDLDTQFCKENVDRTRRYSEETLRDVAIYVCRLIPTEANRENRQNFYNLSKTLLKIEDVYQIDINGYSDEKLWSASSKLLCKFIASTISGSTNIDALSKTIHCNASKTFELLNCYYSYKNRKNWSFADDKVFPNQNGIFCGFGALFKEDGEINDLLKDIIFLIDPNLDYRAILIDKRCSVLPEQKKTKEDAYKLINDTVKEKFDVSSNWEHPDFKKAVRVLIEDWGDNYSGEFTEKNFPSICPIKDKILMNVVWTKEERSRVNKLQKLVKDLTDEQIEKLTDAVDENASLSKQVEELKAEIARLKQSGFSEQLEEVVFVSGQKVSLGADKQTMFEAQVKAQQFLKETKPNWQYPENYGCADENGKPYYYSTVSGIKDEMGNSMALVVKSYRNTNYPFKVNTNEWEWITSEKQATMWVFTGNDLIQISADDLIRNQHAISISFSSENLAIEEHKDRVSDLAEALHYFNEMHFDFTKFSMPQNGMSIRNFENKISEEPASNDSEDDLKD